MSDFAAMARQLKLEQVAMPAPLLPEANGQFDRVRKRLLRQPGVVGAGLTSGGRLLVYVEDQVAAARIPAELDGVRTCVEVSGQVGAL